MKSRTGASHSWLGKLLRPTINFYDLLNRQAQTTLEGLEALADWLHDDLEARCQRVRDLENEADALKIDLEQKLVSSFITPFDREDIFLLSASLDEVINGAKAIAREIEAFNVSFESRSIQEMTGILVDGTRCLKDSIYYLETDLKQAAEHALRARKAENRFAKAYRNAVRELLELEDFKTILRTKEVYRQLLICAERIDRVGENLLHTIIKMT